ncbi:Gfo/Idh/MocA family protein [Vibrio sp. TRT 21S02]|uniref:Gfo/Idh/MocA family protein n=1 Tax=Vibrio sp. TRT 21S02 TaxID=3418507 RepID=UPI003CECAA84
MINFAVIGTNWITEKFVEAAQETGLMKLAAVYSRAATSAQEFAEKFNIDSIETDLTSLAQRKDIQAIYIASPNSFHCAQSILMMSHGKHVICEKPIASNLDEAKQMFQVAQENNVILFEAYKTQYLPNFTVLKQALDSIGKIHKVHLTYCQYSSRYQRYLDGENPNTFNPEFSNGSLVDIGFYCVSAMVSLFGQPLSFSSRATLLESGVDGHGSASFEYPDFSVEVSHSKVSNGYAPSEIQGEEGAILIDHIAELNRFTVHYRNGLIEEHELPQSDNSMFYEAKAFAEHIIEQKNYDNRRALIVSRLLTEIRRSNGVIYPADAKANLSKE